MKLFILGATGNTGGELIDLALARGHSVTAFVRSPHKIARSHARLFVCAGDPYDTGAMAEAMRGHDAVLSALGPRPREAITGTTLLRVTAGRTIAAMQAADVRRSIIVSSAMLFPIHTLLFALSRLIIAAHARDLRAMEEVVTASGLDWTIMRPPRLIGTRAPRDERYRAAEDALPAHASVLSWRALAACMLDSAEEARAVRRVIGVARATRARAPAPTPA